ncbi:MAG: hypothetical protein R3F18_00610 [Lysobacterales bacterium]|nr:hypothetical protein [Xanthomonadales bacterium]
MSNFKHECSDSTPIAKRSDSRWQPQPGQQLAVIAGEGQGWMAQVIATQVGARERVYWVRLADGRRLVKLASELAELTGIDDAAWTISGRHFG